MSDRACVGKRCAAGAGGAAAVTSGVWICRGRYTRDLLIQDAMGCYMGEAKRRKAEIQALQSAHQEWLAGLLPTERTGADVALQAYERIVQRKSLVGGCYLLAFFLHEYLHSQRQIQTELVVGWVNDGTWPGMASHAWIELGGKKIDISLVRTEHPDAQVPGDLIILDRIIRPGKARYTYYRERSVEALAHLQQAIRDGYLTAEATERKDKEHSHVLAMSRSPASVRQFLDSAPADRNFRALAALMG